MTDAFLAIGVLVVIVGVLYAIYRLGYRHGCDDMCEELEENNQDKI